MTWADGELERRDLFSAFLGESLRDICCVRHETNPAEAVFVRRKAVEIKKRRKRRVIDIKPFIADKLKALADVELSFFRGNRQLPLICITETANSSEIVINGQDRVSRITVQLDVYAQSAAELEELAQSVNGKMLGAGLSRSSSETIYSESVPRKCMRYTCRVDEVEKRIFK